MRNVQHTNKPNAPQYTSSLATDLEGLSHELMAMSESVTVEQWSRLRLIIMQMRALAGQVDGLVIPDSTEAA